MFDASPGVRRPASACRPSLLICRVAAPFSGLTSVVPTGASALAAALTSFGLLGALARGELPWPCSAWRVSLNQLLSLTSEGEPGVAGFSVA